MAFSFIYIFHKFNRFLGTPAGDLLKRGSELLLLTFACYMVASELLRTKSRDLKFLLVGFGSLALEKFIASAFLLHVVFAGYVSPTAADYIRVGENFLEIGALIMISSAFLYPIHKKHNISLRSKTYVELIGAVTVFAFSAALAFDLIQFPFGTRRRIILSLMSLSKFLILWFPVYIFWRKDERTVYNKAVSNAFMVYSLTPFLNLINWSFYAGNNANLGVLAHPFPFIAVILFTRVVYLKLVDKATLKDELSSTRKKYIREKEISKMKDEFVSTVSHELRTPLTSIRLYLSLLKQGKFGDVTQKQAETLQTVDHESKRLNTLINDILTHSRFEKDKEVVSKKKTNLYKLVDSCLYAHLIEGKNIVVHNTIDPLLQVSLDQDKFRQVVINLFSNAVKHTDAGEIRFSAQQNNNYLRFSVADTGKGIPSDALPYLFDKFYQAEGHMQRKTGGLGLGLAISKKIVDLHGGKINVQSELNIGTTFTISIPLEEKNNSVSDEASNR